MDKKLHEVLRVLVWLIVALLSFAFMLLSVLAQSVNWLNKIVKCCNWCTDTTWICLDVCYLEPIHFSINVFHGLLQCYDGQASLQSTVR
jgi:uncharacterized membrane protein